MRSTRCFATGTAWSPSMIFPSSTGDTSGPPMSWKVPLPLYASVPMSASDTRKSKTPQHSSGASWSLPKNDSVSYRLPISCLASMPVKNTGMANPSNNPKNWPPDSFYTPLDKSSRRRCFSISRSTARRKSQHIAYQSSRRLDPVVSSLCIDLPERTKPPEKPHHFHVATRLTL